MKQAEGKQAPLGVFSETGKLRTVLTCRPGLAHQRLTPSNCDSYLFDDVFWVQQAKSDHHDFTEKMKERGIEVLEMHELLGDILSDRHLANGYLIANSQKTTLALAWWMN